MCHYNQQCVNTVGAYRCQAKCGPGFKPSVSGMSCEGNGRAVKQTLIAIVGPGVLHCSFVSLPPLKKSSVRNVKFCNSACCFVNLFNSLLFLMYADFSSEVNASSLPVNHLKYAFSVFYLNLWFQSCRCTNIYCKNPSGTSENGILRPLLFGEGHQLTRERLRCPL